MTSRASTQHGPYRDPGPARPHDRASCRVEPMIDAEMRTVRRDRWPSETPWMLGLAIRGAADVAVEARRRRRKDEQGVRSPPPGGISMKLDATIAGLPADHWAREDGGAWRGLSVAEVAPCRGSRGGRALDRGRECRDDQNPILSPFDEAYARYRAEAALLASGEEHAGGGPRPLRRALGHPGISAPRPSRKTCCRLRATRISAWPTRANRRRGRAA